MEYTKRYKEYECGCEIATDGLGSYEIEYCPKHKAAPALYEACKAVDKYLSTTYPWNMPLKKTASELVEAAIAKAEGK